MLCSAQKLSFWEASHVDVREFDRSEDAGGILIEIIDDALTESFCVTCTKLERGSFKDTMKECRGTVIMTYLGADKIRGRIRAKQWENIACDCSDEELAEIISTLAETCRRHNIMPCGLKTFIQQEEAATSHARA